MRGLTEIAFAVLQLQHSCRGRGTLFPGEINGKCPRCGTQCTENVLFAFECAVNRRGENTLPSSGRLLQTSGYAAMKKKKTAVRKAGMPLRKEKECAATGKRVCCNREAGTSSSTWERLVWPSTTGARAELELRERTLTAPYKRVSIALHRTNTSVLRTRSQYGARIFPLRRTTESVPVGLQHTTTLIRVAPHSRHFALPYSHYSPWKLTDLARTAGRGHVLTLEAKSRARGHVSCTSRCCSRAHPPRISALFCRRKWRGLPP
eukprot:3829607-Rhodomonas_salina.2